MTITPTWCHFQFFWRCFISLINFRYLSKCHIRIIIGSWVMTILILWGINKKSKSQVAPVLVLLNIWRLGRVRDTKFGTNVSNKMLLNAAKRQGYSLYYFWVSKENQEGDKIKHPPRLGLKIVKNDKVLSLCRF